MGVCYHSMIVIMFLPLLIVINFHTLQCVSSSSSEPEVVTVDVYEAKALIRSGHRYLDVRTEEEFNKGHLDVGNVLNIAYMFNTTQGWVKNPRFLEQVTAACKKEDLIIVGCKSGMRSMYASVDLLKAEYKNVSNMGGGYLAWVENNLGVKKVDRGEKEKFADQDL